MLDKTDIEEIVNKKKKLSEAMINLILSTIIFICLIVVFVSSNYKIQQADKETQRIATEVISILKDQNETISKMSDQIERLKDDNSDLLDDLNSKQDTIDEMMSNPKILKLYNDMLYDQDKAMEAFYKEHGGN